jgi:hypothetical protein
VCTVAFAQTSPPFSVPGAPADQMKQLAELQAAQAAARRPGDEKLSCDEIKAENTAILQDPAMKAYQADTIAAAQGAQNPLEMTQKLGALTPKLMRSQVLTQLAVGKNCEWLTEMPVAAPPTTPNEP